MVSPRCAGVPENPDFREKWQKSKKKLKTFKICLTHEGNFLYKGRLGNDIACPRPLKKPDFLLKIKVKLELDDGNYTEYKASIVITKRSGFPRPFFSGADVSNDKCAAGVSALMI